VEQPKRDLQLIDASPWRASLLAGRYPQVIRDARALRERGCIGAFHLELLAQVGTRSSESLETAERLVKTLKASDLYDRAPELLEARELWVEGASWYLHYELGLAHRGTCGERLEELILGELGIFRAHADPEDMAGFKALSSVKRGELEEAFDLLFEASSDHPNPPPQGSVFKRAGQALFQAVPRGQRLDVLRYRRGKDPVSYGLAPFPGHGFLIKEYVGSLPTGQAPLLNPSPPPLSPIVTTGWIKGWTREDGFPETAAFERVESLLNDFRRGKKAS
jgi:hypothetical protein